MEEDTRRAAVAALKTQIKEQATEGRRLRIEASAPDPVTGLTPKGIEKHWLDVQRGHLGTKTRWLLLAYALLRRKSYAKVEQKSRRPYYSIAHPVWSALKKVLPALGEREFDVQGWLIGTWALARPAAGTDDAPATGQAACGGEVRPLASAAGGAGDPRDEAVPG